jgi:hypothetical protein
METITTTTKQNGNRLYNNNPAYKKTKKIKNNKVVQKTRTVKTSVPRIRNLNARPNKPICNAYTDTLLQPQFYKGVGVPGQLGAATIALHRHITVPVTTNAGGFIAVSFQPYSLHDINDVKSTLGLCNGALYDGATNISFIAQAYNMSLGGAQLDGFRLVSAEMQVHPQISLLNMNGTLYGAVTHYDNVLPVAPGSTLNYPNNNAIAANIENYEYNDVANVSQQVGLRMIYTPADLHDFQFYTSDFDEIAGTERECTFIVVGAGFPATSKFNLEIYLNFELLPAVGSILQGMEKVFRDAHAPTQSVLKIMASPQLVIHPFREIAHVAYAETDKNIVKVADRQVRKGAGYYYKGTA